MDEKLCDIADACHILGTTSRTLRYYEQLGLIETEFEPRHEAFAYAVQAFVLFHTIVLLYISILPAKQIYLGKNEEKTDRLKSISKKSFA